MAAACTKSGRQYMKKGDSFSCYHPIINFLYFICTIGYALAFTHPVCVGMSFIGAFVYSVVLRGLQGLKTNIIYMVPLILLTALFNPLFSHQGMTVLWHFPSGNALTLESIAYGVMAAFLLVTVICWFSCFNVVISSDKLVYLFGRLAPVLSLVLSMTLRFIPELLTQFGRTYRAQRAAGFTVKDGHFRRLREGAHVLSAVVTWALERALVTADSMKARGYGLPGRTAYSLFRFRKRDACALIFILACSGYVLWGAVRGGFSFWYYPEIRGQMGGMLTVSMYVVYACLILMPVFMEIWRTARMRGKMI